MNANLHPFQLLTTLVVLHASTWGIAQEPPQISLMNWDMVAGLRLQRDALDLIQYSPQIAHLRSKFDFGSTVANIKGVAHDGFRFRVPLGCSGLDWLWYFDAPNCLSAWFITDLTEPAGGGFRVFTRPDSDYEGLKSSPDSVRRLQPLHTSFLREGHEYAVWFRLTPEAVQGGKLTVVSTFAPHRDRWPKADMEAALGLRPIP